jgi:protein-disulfide isomerase
MLLPGRRLVQLLIVALAASCAHAPPPSAPAVGPAPESLAPEFNTVGRAEAKVVIIEFTDLQCPYCAQFATGTFPRIKQAYIDTGKIRYVSRDLPLAIHPYALPAAIAARCAGEQGRYWEYRHAVFKAQERLRTDPWELPKELSLDIERFDACRRDGRQLREVQTDAELAASYGLASTPSFVIGRVVNGAVVGDAFSGSNTFEFFAAKIDALLAQ